MINTFCVFNSTRSTNSGFSIRFFQESKTPLQIVRDELNNLILPVQEDMKLTVEVRNRSHHYRGIIVTLGGYNLSGSSSIKASSTFDEGLYEAKPKETILINKKYKNMLTKDGARDLIVTEHDLGSYICIYYKGGSPVYYGDTDTFDEPDCIKYTNKANHLVSLKLVTRQDIPINEFQLIAA
jgi:hypothetical protein